MHVKCEGEAMAHGGNVWQDENPAQWLDYSANIRPGGAPEWVRRAIVKGLDNVGYYPDRAMRRARAALAEYLNISQECVCPTAGGLSAIDMATHLPGDEFVTFAPCFSEYAQLGENRGKKMRRVALLSEKHVIADPAQCVENAALKNSVVWLCNPLNPIGNAFTHSQVLALLEKVEAANGWLVVDEAFIDYCPQHSAVDLIATHERMVVTGSMTKILGIPGVRLGYLCAQRHVLEDIMRYQLTWELSCFAEQVVCALPAHVEEIRRYACENAAARKKFAAELRGLGAFVYPSEAAFLLVDFGRKVHSVQAYLKEKKILTRDCMNFEGIDDGCHLRLAVKDERANAIFIEALREGLKCAGNH